jgi:hypothetical protein
VRVFVHQVVEVSDFPLQTGLVVHGQNLKQISPLHVCLKPNHVLDHLLVVTAEQNLREVLVLNEHLHRALNQASNCHAVRPTLSLQVVQNVSVVFCWHIVVGLCAHDT